MQDELRKAGVKLVVKIQGLKEHKENQYLIKNKKANPEEIKEQEEIIADWENEIQKAERQLREIDEEIREQKLLFI
jgi:hypothetical protein